MTLPENLLVGTSSWSSSDWLGPFYPPYFKPGQYAGLAPGSVNIFEDLWNQV